MLQISHSNELVQRLTARIAGADKHWFIDLAEELETQSDETLSFLIELSKDYTEPCWDALSLALRTFLRGSKLPDNTHLIEDNIPQDEFVLKITFLLVPLSVMRHEKMLGKKGDFIASDNTYGLVDLYDAVTSDIHRLMTDLLPDEESVKIARACYLITAYGRRHKVPLPSGQDFAWMSEHALEIIPIAGSVFDEGVFDRELAELMLQSEPSLRDGVL